MTSSCHIVLSWYLESKITRLPILGPAIYHHVSYKCFFSGAGHHVNESAMFAIILIHVLYELIYHDESLVGSIRMAVYNTNSILHTGS